MVLTRGEVTLEVNNAKHAAKHNHNMYDDNENTDSLVTG